MNTNENAPVLSLARILAEGRLMPTQQTIATPIDELLDQLQLRKAELAGIASFFRYAVGRAEGNINEINEACAIYDAAAARYEAAWDAYKIALAEIDS